MKCALCDWEFKGNDRIAEDMLASHISFHFNSTTSETYSLAHYAIALQKQIEELKKAVYELTPEGKIEQMAKRLGLYEGG